MDWFLDKTVSEGLPGPYQRYARLMRLALNSRGRRLHGPFTFPYLSSLIRNAADESKRIGASRVASVQFPRFKLCVDMYDSRALLVLQEAMGDNTETQVIYEFLDEGDTFLDVGANHGTYSMVAAHRVGTRGKIIAFEPQPFLANLIRASAEANCFTNVDVREVALSDTEGEAEFFIPKSSGMGGLHKEFSAEGNFQTIKVALAKLDSLEFSTSFSGKMLIKVDVEGNEVKFLNGAQRFLKDNKPTVLFELNQKSQLAAGYSNDILIQTFLGLGYKSCVQIEDISQRIPLTELSEKVANDQKHLNILAYYE
ncbi:MAG: hypothetical protein OHK0029_21750 [Armatimonadaceae bacterium]